MGLTETECERRCIELAQDHVRWRSFVLVVLNLWVLLALSLLVSPPPPPPPPPPAVAAATGRLLGSTESLKLHSMKWQTCVAAYFYSTQMPLWSHAAEKCEKLYLLSFHHCGTHSPHPSICCICHVVTTIGRECGVATSIVCNQNVFKKYLLK
jgi:hypothetical protein